MNLLGLYSKVIKKLHGKYLSNCTLHPTSKIYSGCEMYDCEFGKYSYVSYDSKFISTTIGSFCSIADHVYIGGNEHPLSWVSTSPIFQKIENSGSSFRFAEFEINKQKRTSIGSDVWIGHGAIIKAGVNIGHGAVIGAGAVVTKDIPPYAIVGGVPAKVIKYRFDEQTIADLLESKWWELPDDKIKEVARYIKEPKQFLEEINKL